MLVKTILVKIVELHVIYKFALERFSQFSTVRDLQSPKVLYFKLNSSSLT